jgi:hypothetical protein
MIPRPPTATAAAIAPRHYDDSIIAKRPSILHLKLLHETQTFPPTAIPPTTNRNPENDTMPSVKY